MAIKTSAELMEQFNTIIGEENASDEVLAFMTDMRDTLSNTGTETIENLRREKDELDKTWRKKYRDAFMSSPERTEDDEPPKKKTFDDLFTTKE